MNAIPFATEDTLEAIALLRRMPCLPEFWNQADAFLLGSVSSVAKRFCS